VADQLAYLTPQPGDAVFIPAGTVHSLGGDIMVFEVQENRFDVYYGMADSRIGVARLDVPDLVPTVGVADPPDAKV
jgi:mannose-6-phosphate isomerase